MILSEQDWNHIFAPAMKLVKNWMKLPKNTPSSLLFHEGGLGMDHPWKQYCINTITELMVRLNSMSHASTSSLIRLRDAQLKSLITDPIFECDLQAMPWTKAQARKNVSFNALIISKALDISVEVDSYDKTSWSVIGGNEPILNLFKQFHLTKYIYRINQSSHYLIYYIDQLFIRGTHIMTWKQYRRLAALPVKGRVARWFRDVIHLCTSRTDNTVISNELEINRVNHWDFLQDIIPDARRKQIIFIQKPTAENSETWTIGKVSKIHRQSNKISVTYRQGCNVNGIIRWQNIGYTAPAECCKVAILDKDPNTHEWQFPKEWISSNYQNAPPLFGDRSSVTNSNPIIILPLVQDIWIHRWIDDDNLKTRLIEIRNSLAERTSVEFYTDGSLTPNFPSSIDKQDTNLVYTDMGAAFCVNNEPLLSV
jgi:hypothetical protein